MAVVGESVGDEREPAAAGAKSASAARTNPTRCTRGTVSPPCGRLLDERLPKSQRDGMRARVGVELPHRVADVRAGGLTRDVQPSADLLVAQPVGQQAQPFATVAIARDTSASGASLRTNPRTPASSASTSCVRSLWLV